jgi:hypothetical protein
MLFLRNRHGQKRGCTAAEQLRLAPESHAQLRLRSKQALLVKGTGGFDCDGDIAHTIASPYRSYLCFIL